MADIPGNTSTTSSITVGGTVGSTLETLGDHDWFRITLTAGQSITVFVDGITLEDPYVYIRNSAGQLLFENDDINPGVNRDSQVSFTAPSSGTYYIDVGAWDENYTGDYTVSVSVYTPPPLATFDQIANQLVEGYWGGDDHHFNVTQGGSITVNLTALTSAGQNLAREALKLWSDVIGVQFVEVASGGQITFNDNESGAFSDGSWFGGIITSAHVNVSTQWLANYGTHIGSYSFQTYIHEIGHALGLGHAGNYNGEASYPFDAVFENDAWATSIMSYFSQTENTYFAGQGFTENFIVTPMVADILAMSTLYGLSTTTRTGNTTYGFNSTAGRAVYDATQNPSVAYTVFDSGGNDTLDYSGFSNNQRINLNPETFSSVGTEIGNVSIARGVIIENAIGGAGNDILTGNAVANLLIGNAGNDILNGGAGADTMTGGLGNDSYVVDQAGDVISEVSGQGDDTVVAKTTYTLGAGVSVEAMTTINSSTTTPINLTGNEFAQSIYGNAGNNILTGMGGADYLVGGSGNDQFHVDTSDVISELAGGGDDTVLVATSYFLRDGVEIETLVALDQASLAPVDLAGNEYGQSLYGSQGANSLNGGAGNDYLVGLGGNDFLQGGAGNDNMAGGAGNDIYYVDGGDWVIEAAGEGDDLVIAFDNIALRAGESIETMAAAEGSSNINLTGNTFAQSLYGNAGANILAGGGGADYLIGGGGSDTFVISSLAMSGPGNIAGIGDYAAGEVVDITQILAVAAGTNPVTGGYVKVTSAGQLQVDLNGGGDSWTTIANVSGSASVTVRYLSGGSATQLSIARSASQTATMAGVIAATGMAALPAAAKEPSDSSGELLSDFAVSGAALATLESPNSDLASASLLELAGETREPLDSAAATTTLAAKDEAAMELAADAVARPDAAQVAAVPQGTDVPLAHPLVADGVAMPSAEQMQALAPAPEAAEHSQLVGKVLADALAGGKAGGPIDTLLDALAPAEAAAETGAAQLAQQYQAGFDTGHGALTAVAWFQSALATEPFGPSGEAMATHYDAPAAA